MTVGAFNRGDVGPVHLYVAVADHIADRINAGELTPGERLPNERDLAIDYDVSPITVRHAIAVLRDRDLVVTLRGKGTYVAARR